MKAKLIYALSMTGAMLFGAMETVVDWNKTTVGKEKSGSIIFRDSKKYIGRVRDWGNKNSGKAEIRNGKLILDTTCYKASKDYAMLNLKNFRDYAGRMVQIEFDICSNADGCKGDFYFEGSYTDKKHFWTKAPLMITKNVQHIVVKKMFPKNLSYVHFRFDLYTPAVYTIGNIKFGPAEIKEVDGSINYIRNGGAERGFYGVYPPNKKRFGGIMKVFRDDKVFHNGKYSFRLEGQNANYNRLVFGSVPFVIDRPASFSAWIKAEKPLRIELMLFSASGQAYIQYFNVGKEWKKYTLTIPKFGAKAIRGISTVGNPTNPTMHVNPVITLPSNQLNTVWIDDLSYQLNTKTTETSPVIYISGKLDEPCGYYRQGKAITAKMNFEPSGAQKKAVLEYELVDWHGKKLLPTQKQIIALPLKKDFTFKVPSYYIGPMNLKFRVSAGKEVLTHNLYCGVISNDRTLNKRIGSNVKMEGPEDVETTADLLKDFGVGAVRAWHKDSGGKHVDVFRKKGFYVMLCLDFPHIKKGKSKFFIPYDLSEYFSVLGPEIEKYYKGNVDIYEIFNEPNIWSGRSKNPDEKKYSAATPDAVIEATKKIVAFLKKNDPETLRGGPGCCGTNASYIGNYLQKGCGKEVDVITEHPYRFLPEQPDYADELKALHSFGKEIQATESGSRTFGAFPNNEIQKYAVDCAAKDIRLMIVGFANGVKRFYEFSAGGMEIQNEYTALLASGPDENNSWQPSIWLYATKALAPLICENAKATTLKLGFDYRCYIFDNGKDRLAALWKWFGKPAELSFSKTISYQDMMGSTLAAGKITLDHCPIYIRTKQSTAELSKMILNAMPVAEDEVPVKLNADVTGTDTFTLNIKNLTFRTLSGEVKLSTGAVKKFSGLKGESVIKLPFRTTKSISTVPQKVNVTLTIGKKTLKQEISLKAIIVPQTAKKITIDGNLNDWKQYAVLKLDSRNAVKCVPWNSAELQAKSEIRITWDPEYFYVAVIVDKKGFYPEQSLSPWNGDGIQVALDTIRNADDKTIGYQNDDFEYMIWLKGGKPAVFRSNASAGEYDSLSKSIGLVSEVVTAIHNQGNRTVYEMAFPSVAISPFKLFSGSACRFNLIVNMNNGKQRIGWLEITPGIGQAPKKPGFFPDLILSK